MRRSFPSIFDSSGAATFSGGGGSASVRNSRFNSSGSLDTFNLGHISATSARAAVDKGRRSSGGSGDSDGAGTELDLDCTASTSQLPSVAELIEKESARLVLFMTFLRQ